MFSKNNIFLKTILLSAVFASGSFFAKPKNAVDNVISLSMYVEEDRLEVFKEYLDTSLISDLKLLPKNDLGCLLNLLVAQYLLFEVMEEELDGKNQANQEKIEGIMQSFQNSLKTFESQCSEKIKNVHTNIQRAIAELVPAEVVLKTQKLEEKMGALYAKAKEKNSFETENFKNEIAKLQKEFMESFLLLQAITSLASVEVYKAVYTFIATGKTQTLLLERFNVNGIVPLTKRKKNVMSPEKAFSLIESFLKQANTIAAQQN